MTVTLHTRDMENVKIDRRSTVMRKMAEMAVGQALRNAGYPEVPPELNAGIIGCTVVGESYPELWQALHYRVMPHHFLAGILNSVIGHCSIFYHLTGPQILVTSHESIFTVAKLQLASGRSQLMVTVEYDDPTFVEVNVLRKEDE